MPQEWVLPFGQKLESVKQVDRSPKKVFVLGVYASAVHALWRDRKGKSRVNALAVASEPYIFWRGDGIEETIARISIPPELGSLLPAQSRYNGPSGVALDAHVLAPLGLGREDAWLCDLVPHACLNPNQIRAIQVRYARPARLHSLPRATMPPVPHSLADETRRSEVMQEIRESQAHTLILLGDQPIKWFFSLLSDSPSRLVGFGYRDSTSGHLHPCSLEGLRLQILPLAHPRQIARLGTSSQKWYFLHRKWEETTAPRIL